MRHKSNSVRPLCFFCIFGARAPKINLHISTFSAVRFTSACDYIELFIYNIYIGWIPNIDHGDIHPSWNNMPCIDQIELKACLVASAMIIIWSLHSNRQNQSSCAHTSTCVYLLRNLLHILELDANL